MILLVKIFSFSVILLLYSTIGIILNAIYLSRFIMIDPIIQATKVLAGTPPKTASSDRALHESVSRWGLSVRHAYHAVFSNGAPSSDKVAGFSLIANIAAVVIFFGIYLYGAYVNEDFYLSELISWQYVTLYLFITIIFFFYNLIYVPIIAVYYIFVFFFTTLLTPAIFVATFSDVSLKTVLSNFGLSARPDYDAISWAAQLPYTSILYLNKFFFASPGLGSDNTANLFDGVKRILFSILLYLSAFLLFTNHGHAILLSISQKTGIKFPEKLTRPFPTQKSSGETSPKAPIANTRKTSGGPQEGISDAGSAKIVATQDAYIRENPENTAVARRTLPTGKTMNAFQQKGEWVQVGENSPIGWVHLSQVKAAR